MVLRLLLDPNEAHPPADISATIDAVNGGLTVLHMLVLASRETGLAGWVREDPEGPASLDVVVDTKVDSVALNKASESEAVTTAQFLLRQPGGQACLTMKSVIEHSARSISLFTEERRFTRELREEVPCGASL